MRLTVRSSNSRGQLRETVYGTQISVGRGIDNDLVLSDLSLSRRHLQIGLEPDGKLKIECLSPIPIRVDGASVSGTVSVAAGQVVQLGPYQIQLQPGAAGGDAILTLTEAASGTNPASRGFRSLREAGWKIRRPAILASLAVLVISLLIPLASRYVPGSQKLGGLSAQALWSSGPLSFGHRQLETRCDACHETLFVRVRDEACLSCHQGIKHHSQDMALLKETGLDQMRCASCHSEHGTPHTVLPSHPALCVDCHGKASRNLQWGIAGEFRDFGHAHPEFKATTRTFDVDTGEWHSSRTPIAAGIKDQSGMIFPHDLHLDPKGVRGANGTEVLQCASCHAPNIGKAGFVPISYQKNCQGCHALEMNTDKGRITVPHGDLQIARAIVKVFAGPTAATGDAAADSDIPRRPGEQADRGIGGHTSDPVDDTLKRGLCGTCHAFTRQTPATMVEPRLSEQWMDRAHFTHAPHTSVSCGTCHDAPNSSNSDVLMLPGIETCRQCHGGTDDHSKIPSTCISCHAFHPGTGLEMGKPLGSKTRLVAPGSKPEVAVPVR